MKIQKTARGLLYSMISLVWFVTATTPLYAADGQAVFEQTCKMCHGTGIAGAPKAGDADAWGPRIAQGKEVLYEHALNGFKGKSVMPPRGGNKNLTDDEVKAGVDYMVSLIK